MNEKIENMGGGSSSKKTKKGDTQIPRKTINFITAHITKNKENKTVTTIINKILYGHARPSKVRKLCKGNIGDKKCEIALRNLAKIRRDNGIPAAKEIVQPILPELSAKV